MYVIFFRTDFSSSVNRDIFQSTLGLQQYKVNQNPSLPFRAPNLLSFKGVPSPPFWCVTFKGYFPALHKPWVKTQNLIWIQCIWISTVKCNAHSFSQYYNFQNQKITMLKNIGYITELTAWHCYQRHMSDTCVWHGWNRSHFFRLTHSTKF